jgi:hypothetical protein
MTFCRHPFKVWLVQSFDVRKIIPLWVAVAQCPGFLDEEEALKKKDSGSILSHVPPDA